MKQRETIYKLINMQPGEGKVVLLFVVYSLFMGLVIAVFYSCTTALLLVNFGRTSLPMAFIAGGVLVYVLGVLVRWLQRSVPLARLNNYLLWMVVLSLLVLLFFPNRAQYIWIYFILFLWNRVFVFVNGITFWSTASRIFNLQQAKRLFSFISIGDVVSSILSYFSVPILLSFVSTEDLLLVSLVALIICAGLMLVITRRYRHLLITNTSENEQKYSEKPAARSINKHYYRLLYTLALMPVFGLLYVEFMFTTELKDVFPNQEMLASFLGIFFGICSVIELVIKVFFYNRLISMYSIRIGIVALPIFLLFSFTITAVYGSIYGETSLLLAFIALSRFFMSSVRRAVSEPSFQVLFQPIPPAERTRLQSHIEGVPKALGNVVAGMLLLFLTQLSDVTMVQLSYLFLLIIAYWVAASFRLQTIYTSIIQQVVNQAYERARSNSEIRSESTRFFVEDIASSNKNLSLESMEALAISPEPIDRIRAANELGLSGRYYAYIYVRQLLDDENTEVRCAALRAAGKLKKPELWQSLFDHLAIDTYRPTATEAVLAIGKPIVSGLIRCFNQTTHTTIAKVYIVGLINTIGGEDSLRFLRKHMNYPEQAIRDKVFEGLRQLGHKATITERPMVLQQLDEQIGLLVWLAATRLDMIDYAKQSTLIRAIRDEKQLVVPKVFNLLAVLCGDNRFDVVSELITQKNNEIKGYLLELLDNAVPTEVKSRVLPLFADIPIETKLIRCSVNYPQQRLSVEERLHDIINKDFNKITPRLKAIAIRELQNWHETDPTTILVANVASSNELIAETAFYVLKQLNPERFDELWRALCLHADSIQCRLADSVAAGLTEQNLRVNQEETVLNGSIDVVSH